MRFFLALSFLLSSQVYAANLNLSPGESTVVNANTTISCGVNAAGSDCTHKASSLKEVFDKCTQQIATEWCFHQVWPNWKENNRTCVTEGTQICLDKCLEVLGNDATAWCIGHCQ